jgi:hypothetical protein
VDARLRFFFNDDGDRPFYKSQGPFVMQHLTDPVDVLAGTPVTTLVYHVGSDLMFYPSEVASEIGWRETPTDKQNWFFRRGAKLARVLRERGIDPVDVIMRRAVERELEFIPSLRMNDAHYGNKVPATEHPFTARFWMDHPQLRIVPDAVWAPECLLDFSHAEVRAYRLAAVEEIIGRYAESGIELDFTRHAAYFPEDRVRPELLTAVVRETRRLLDERGEQGGRPLLLVVRVGPTLQESLKVGLDVAAWIKEGLIDYAIIAPFHDLLFDYDLRVDEYVAAAQGSRCRVIGAPDAEGPRLGLIPIEMYRAANANYNHMGQQGAYLFNFFGGRYPYSPGDYGLMRDISSPEALRGRDKHFMWSSWRQHLPNSPRSPVALREAGDSFAVPIYVGDDVRQSAAENILKGVELTLRVEDLQPDDRLEVRINGHPVSLAEARIEATDFQKWRRGPPFYKWEQQIAKGPFVTVSNLLLTGEQLPEQGINTVTISLGASRNPDHANELRITAVDLWTRYDLGGVDPWWDGDGPEWIEKPTR